MFSANLSLKKPERCGWVWVRCWVKRKLHWDWEFSIATISPHNLSEPAWVQFHKNIESRLHLYLRAPERRDKCINTWGFVMWQSNFVPWPKFRDCFDVVVLQLFSRCVHLCISWDLHFPYLFPIFKCVKTIYRFFFINHIIKVLQFYVYSSHTVHIFGFVKHTGRIVCFPTGFLLMKCLRGHVE